MTKHNKLKAGLLNSTSSDAMIRPSRISRPLSNALGLLAGIGMAIAPDAARAFSLYDGSQYGNNVEVHLDTTFSYTGIVRTQNPSVRLTGVSNLNGNDGDLNFAHGMVSNLFEVTPVLDIRDGDFGAHFSGDAYLNPNYLMGNQNNSPSTNNSISIAKNTDFTSATRNVEGENAELLDAFVYGAKHFGNDQVIILKVGRQTLLWGQSLFLSNNGIAGGMTAFDVVTADNNPTAQTQQLILPAGQVVATYQPNQVVTLQGYYQFEWQPDKLEAVGSYFSTTDILDKGGQRLLFAPDFGVRRTKDVRPPINNGQFGASLQLTLGNYDLGFYGLRYDSKSPTVYLASPYAQSYSVVYPRDIYIEGVALSTTVGATNIAGELSSRQHMNLATGANFSATGNVNSAPAFPVGDTIAGQVSAIYVSPGIPLDPGGVTVDGEIGFNHVVKVTANDAAITSPATGGLRRSSTAADMEVVASPTYYNPIPNMTLSFPIGLTYNLYGRSEVDPTENHGTGSISVGVSVVYKTVWIASVTFDDHLGAANPLLSGEPSVADRNYVLLNLQRSF